MKKPFAQTLLDWRRQRKLNRAEACRLFNVPYRTWQDWEAEIHIPNPFVQKAILAQLEMYRQSKRIRMTNALKIAKSLKGAKPYTHKQLITAGRDSVFHVNRPENFGKEINTPHGTESKNLAQD